MVAVSFLPRLARVHCTLLVTASYAQTKPPPVALTKVTPLGSASSTVTPVAVLGPLLLTVSVYVSVAPASTGSGLSAFVMVRSTVGLTVVVTVALVLLPGFWSGSLARTVAELVIVPPSSGARTVKVIVAGVVPVGGS